MSPLSYSAGSRLGAYEVLSPIGAGGMGEVYRARDTKLGREVAIKVLPEVFAQDNERRKRFEREAQSIAALNHPNIVHVYSVEEADGIHFITMELVEGKTFAELLPKRGFPLDRFFDIAVPLAEALAAAHDKGITHRDLKPQNVMVSDEGRVKVLDFGLAKAAKSFLGDGAGSELPTETKTQEGAIVGTLTYMSPEQAQGKAIDRRSDIFSLGIIFHEMLTGRRPFGGETPAELMSSIIKDAPPSVAEARPEISRELSRLVGRCLAKDPARRIQTALDVRNELEASRDADEGPAYRPTRINRWLAVATAISVLALIGFVVYRPSTPHETIPRLSNPRQLTSAAGVEDFPTWSPDGDRLAFQSGGDIWVAQLGGGAPVNLTASADSLDAFPAWSPDGSQIAFRSRGDGVFTIPAVGGTPRKLLAWEAWMKRPQWSRDGNEIAVVYGHGADLFMEILSLETEQTRQLPIGRRCLDPSWSPDRSFLACVDAGSWNNLTTSLWLFPLSGDEPILVTEKGGTAEWSPTWSLDGARLFFLSNRGGSMDLWVQGVGSDGAMESTPEPVTTGLVLRRAVFSPEGTKLAYTRGRLSGNAWRVPIRSDRPASWKDALQITFDDAYTRGLDVSSDGRLVVDSDRGGNRDLWVVPSKGGPMHQLTALRSVERNGIWSPDEEWIAFQSDRSGNEDLWLMPSAGGPARPIVKHPAADYMPAWSPDGQLLAFTSRRSGNPDIWVVSVEGGEPRQVTTHPAYDQLPTWSPDGKWLVFDTARTGSTSLWRVPASGGEAEPLTQPGQGGFSSCWSPDGSRLFFRGSGRGQICEISLKDRTERVVADLSDRLGAFGALATDGDFLYFIWEEDEGDIWVMDVVESQ